ncbi:MAG TPA: type IV pilus twitching motility protein PilT [Polyangia bacterium]|nr:type IV pilus twitching motility protein PilT [Polyangia bacterium]
MPVIDRYLEAMVKHRAEQLVFRSGSTVTLVIGGATRPISSRPATEDQITGVLTEALGSAYTPGLSGNRTFPYEAPTGAVSIQVEDGNEGLTVRVQPSGAAAAAALTSPPTRAGRSASTPIAAIDVQRTPVPVSMPSVSMPTNGSSLERHREPREPTPPLSVRPAFVETPVPTPSPPAAPAPAPAPPPAVPVAPPAPRAAVSAAGGPVHIDDLFGQMLDMKASDLHLKSNAVPQLRIDGSMVAAPNRGPLTPEQLEGLIYAITPERNKHEFADSNDTDFAYTLTGRARMRCNVFRDIAGIGAVFRQIPSKILTAQQLNLPKAVLDMCELDKGLVVVTGPTGSGKSTTLAAMVDWINTNRDDHIITIEDPVEFVHPDKKCLINQREVGTQTKSFKAALRAALREDPDIVLVGEMRDLETVAIAIETAETGHLVFGTLHTNTAPSTIDRLIDQFPADRQEQIRVMLSESLKGVVAQTLLKKKGGGRVAALEILLVTPAVANLIREGKTFQVPSLMQTGRGLGMVTLMDSLFDLVKNGTVEAEEAYSRAPHKKEFASMLTKNGFPGPWSQEKQ